MHTISCDVLQLNYQFMKRCVESGPVTELQTTWFENILSLIPAMLKDNRHHHTVMKSLFDEIVANFKESMKKSMGTCLARRAVVMLQ